MNPPESAPSTSNSAAVTGTSPPTPAVAAVSLKLPPFWPNDPAVWFAQVEAQFLTRSISSQATKFAYVIASLPPKIAQEIRDLLISPPSADQYITLKSELIKRTSASEKKRLHQLLISEELGDRKPSQLLRKMRQLLGDNRLEDGIIRQFFLQRLPTNVQLILASTAVNVPLDELAILADRILEVAPSQTTIAAFSSSTSGSSAINELDALRTQVDTLTHQLTNLVNQLSVHPRSRSLSRSASPQQFHRRRYSSASSSNGTQPFCWYHRKFGSQAHRCKAPCSFSTSSQQTENFQASN